MATTSADRATLEVIRLVRALPLCLGVEKPDRYDPVNSGLGKPVPSS